MVADVLKSHADSERCKQEIKWLNHFLTNLAWSHHRQLQQSLIQQKKLLSLLQVNQVVQVSQQWYQLILTYSVAQQKLKLYLLFSVCERFSSNGAKYLNQTFQSMFLECSTAQKIQLGSDKLKYVINWGLPHHFKTKLQKYEFLVISLDESLNKSTQNCEMILKSVSWVKKQKMLK